MNSRRMDVLGQGEISGPEDTLFEVFALETKEMEAWEEMMGQV